MTQGIPSLQVFAPYLTEWNELRLKFAANGRFDTEKERARFIELSEFLASFMQEVIGK